MSSSFLSFPHESDAKGFDIINSGGCGLAGGAALIGNPEEVVEEGPPDQALKEGVGEILPLSTGLSQDDMSRVIFATLVPRACSVVST
jgi:hypothetical protein